MRNYTQFFLVSQIQRVGFESLVCRGDVCLFVYICMCKRESTLEDQIYELVNEADLISKEPNV
jgi:hypothetical protein